MFDIPHLRGAFIHAPKVELFQFRTGCFEGTRYRAYAKVDTTALYGDEWGDYHSHRLNQPKITIWMENFQVTRLTPKGAWISTQDGDRFVLNGNGKRYAYETQEWALESLRIRQKRRQKFLLRDLETTALILHGLQELKETTDNPIKKTTREESFT